MPSSATHRIPDYYAVLGVPRTATPAEIKSAYRKLARKYHPDRSKEPDAAERMKAINEANDILGDATKRAEYDAMLDAPHSRNFDSSFASGGAEGFEVDDDILRDFYARFFGGNDGFGFAQGPRRRGFRDTRGQDVYARLALTLEEAHAGSSHRVELNGPNGRKTLRVQIPAGMLQDEVLRLREQGGAGTPNGDLNIAIDIAPHPHFRLEGADIVLEVPIAPWEAALGAKITVPTLGGRVQVDIPAGQRGGNRIRLAHRGMPARGARATGHQYLVMRIEVPRAKSDEAKALYSQLAQLPHEPLRHW